MSDYSHDELSSTVTNKRQRNWGITSISPATLSSDFGSVLASGSPLPEGTLSLVLPWLGFFEEQLDFFRSRLHHFQSGWALKWASFTWNIHVGLCFNLQFSYIFKLIACNITQNMFLGHMLNILTHFGLLANPSQRWSIKYTTCMKIRMSWFLLLIGPKMLQKGACDISIFLD